MAGFFQEHLRPLVGSAALHAAIVAVLAGAALTWTSKQPPVQLAIEGVVVDSRDLPKQTSGTKPSPRPAPKPVTPPPPEPEPVANEAPPELTPAEVAAAQE